MILPPINFKNWIEDNMELLKPPVCNKVVYEDTEFIIMVVGGPNTRKDYHVDEGEEFFYQLEGKMILRIIENGAPKDIKINEGEIFLLPPTVPHSPQRFEISVGLVIERKRTEEELDGFQWYCDKCNNFCTNNNSINGLHRVTFYHNKYINIKILLNEMLNFDFKERLNL